METAVWAGQSEGCYVDGVDPDGGYCVIGETRRRLILPGVHHLVELAPSWELHQGFTAIKELMQALETGILPGRRHADLGIWINRQPDLLSRHLVERTIQNALSFLQGKRIEDAPEIFLSRYRIELSHPRTLAAICWLRAREHRSPITLYDSSAELVASAVAQVVSLSSPLRGESPGRSHQRR